MKNILILSTAILLVGCATASQPGAMVAPVVTENIIDGQSKLSQSVNVAEVEGGKKTNPLWVSNVSNEDFTEALTQSLAAHAMLSIGEGDYKLTAELVKLKQPFVGLNMSVTSTVKYVLTEVATGNIVFDETIEEKYTAKMGDAFVGVKRLQLANEGSIKSNISSLISLMIEKVDGMSDDVASSKTISING